MSINVEQSYHRYGPMVLRRCRQLLKREEDALDAMQEVFVNALVRQENLNDSGLSSLFYRMATNTCLNRIRAMKRRPETPDEVLLHEIAIGADQERRSWSRDLLTRLFQGDKETTQTIATLHYVDGMTLAEVAEEVGMSVSGVRKRLRGLKRRLEQLESTERRIGGRR